MKKALPGLLAVLLMFSLCACGGGAASDDPNVGLYTCTYVEMMGMGFAAQEIFESGATLELKPNGKGTMNLDDSKGAVKWSADGGVLTLTVSRVTYVGAISNGVITIELYDSMILTFAKEGAESSGAGAPVSPNSQLYWQGDWYGWLRIPTASGEAWEELEDYWWDCYAQITVDADGVGTMYIYSDDIEFAKVQVSFSGNAAMSEGGWFVDAEVGHADWIIDPTLYEYENLLVIDGTYEDPLGDGWDGFSYVIWLRPWGRLWDDVPNEDRPPYYDWYVDYVAEGSAMPKYGELAA